MVLFYRLTSEQLHNSNGIQQLHLFSSRSNTTADGNDSSPWMRIGVVNGKAFPCFFF
jgi:hypothetical protein